jgi:hypothetical protein
MKKYNEAFDFFVLEILLNYKGIDEEKAKQVKRFWLREELYNYYGASHTKEMEEAFEWIYNASLIDWEGMLLCIKYPDNKTFPKPLEDAKKLFAFLS